MGYANYIDQDGRPAGYAVEATCDQDGCSTEIGRGVSFRCGDTGDDGCARFFCYDHLFHRHPEYRQLCGECSTEADRCLTGG